MTPLSRVVLAPEVLAAAKAGERAAQAEIYAAVAPATMRLISRLVPAHAAEDVFQDVLMLAFERLDGWNGSAPFGAWLRAIAVNRALTYLRSPWHRLRDWVGGSVEEAADAVQLQGIAARDTEGSNVDLARLLARLSPAARAVLWLYAVEGYSHAEIAAASGRSLSYSKSIVARAQRELRALAQTPDAMAATRVNLP